MGILFGGGVVMTDRSRAPMRENCSVRGIGVAVRVRVSTPALRLFQPLLHSDTETLLLVNDQQPEILEFDLLPCESCECLR
ncbi:MAG: hypothetical protein MZV63_52225 [Marinilabiliales bacterium]|nr:hypothetical protein [Marinilabiliales bacterium]